MDKIYIFLIGAVVVGTIFLVSLLELLFTIRRRKVNARLRQKLQELKGNYTESINKMVLENDAKLEETEKKLEVVSENLSKEKGSLEEEYKRKISDITAKSKHSLELAQDKAKRLEMEAHQKADVYLEERKKEVEEELMNLVISVNKKVLPEGISYSAQKELVMKALHDVKDESIQN